MIRSLGVLPLLHSLLVLREDMPKCFSVPISPHKDLQPKVSSHCLRLPLLPISMQTFSHHLLLHRPLPPSRHHWLILWHPHNRSPQVATVVNTALRNHHRPVQDKQPRILRIQLAIPSPAPRGARRDKRWGQPLSALSSLAPDLVLKWALRGGQPASWEAHLWVQGLVLQNLVYMVL